jgi:hypothetical protein
VPVAPLLTFDTSSAAATHADGRPKQPSRLSALIEFRITYLLEKASDGYKILSYISEADQEAEMRKLGLL